MFQKKFEKNNIFLYINKNLNKKLNKYIFDKIIVK